MKFAYADPPYPGCAKMHYADDPSGIQAEEVNHAELIQRLAGFSAWALSTSSSSLRDILPMCPDGTRVAAWVKPVAARKPWIRAQYAWEPVLFWGERPKSESDCTFIADWVSALPPVFSRANIGNTKGQKPVAFCLWLFALMGLREGDELHDLFPGSGAVGSFWQTYLAQQQLPLSETEQFRPEQRMFQIA